MTKKKKRNEKRYIVSYISVKFQNIGIKFPSKKNKVLSKGMASDFSIVNTKIKKNQSFQRENNFQNSSLYPAKLANDVKI